MLFEKTNECYQIYIYLILIRNDNLSRFQTISFNSSAIFYKTLQASRYKIIKPMNDIRYKDKNI